VTSARSLEDAPTVSAAMAAPHLTGVLAIFGPTASGKSDVAEAIADRIPAELVSADAMQAYRGLPILTNQSRRPTHLVAVWPLDHEGSVAEFERLAHATIDEILARRRTPVVLGGTGLYLRAALADLAIPPAPPRGVRERMESLYERLGPDPSHALLAERDPAAAAAVHPNDRRRVVRALELAELGSSLRPADHRLWDVRTRHPTLIVGLDIPVEELDRRIEERTRSMFERGVEDEVRRALALGSVAPTAWSVLGLRQLAELPPDEARPELVRMTRRYARYQRKWMRRIPGLVTVDADRPAGEVADEILEVARARQHLPRRRAG
jgi:tRNA dimethylallyltransferase